ncbi:MAG: hypothetical protein JJE13_12480 [Thermoleophilia bacterium]|nr:hypothetical protein [Thermoleophilia bacterium]
MFCITAVLAAGVVLSACGSETHENNPRPPVPPVVSISISDDTIEVSPLAVGVPGKRPVNINQNQLATEGQANPKAPAVVAVAISNLTNRNTELILEGPVERSEPLTATGSGSFQAALPTGIYRFSSPASSGTARFAVGPSRVSASGDLLTP